MNGRVAEWLRHRSAKPGTAVRIRPRPQQKRYPTGYLFYFHHTLKQKKSSSIELDKSYFLIGACH